MNSRSALSSPVMEISKELPTLGLGGGVLALLSFSRVLEWLLASDPGLIIAGLLNLGSRCDSSLPASGQSGGIAGGSAQGALNTLFRSVLAAISLTVFLLRPHPKVLGSEGLMLLVVFLF